MKTDREIPLTMTGQSPVPYPERVRGVEDHIATTRGAIRGGLEAFRAALHPFAADCLRDAAKRVAIAQNAHTLALGRGELSRLKGAIEEYAQDPLPRAIEQEFTVERYGEASGASSGQVATIIPRRFDDGIRKLLLGIGPILERFGFGKDDAALSALELPDDLKGLIAEVVDAITDIKVAEAKLQCFERQREKELAAELWESS